MKIKPFLILLLFVALPSCNQEVKEKPVVEEQVKTPNQLIVDANIKVTKPADIKLFANKIFLNNDQEMNISITHRLNASPDAQDVQFKFPEGLNPDYQLGLSLGPKNEKEVELNQLIVTYGATKFTIEPESLSDYLVFNKFIEVDSVTNKLVTKKLGNAHNPMIFFRRKILDSLQYIQ